MNAGPSIEALLNGSFVSEEDSERLFERLVRGELDDIETTALLVVLKMRGETPQIIAGAARALRAAALPFDSGLDVADSCGTGGDGCHTLNVSTAVAIVAAELGVPMAKHGNRSVSSRCGSADVLEALGVHVMASPQASRRALHEAGICFLFAPQYHAGLGYASKVRRRLRVRTILNLLGPLVNPARPAWQVVGVYDPRLCVSVAETLGRLGCRSALVLHGDGLDEMAPHGPTHAALLRDGIVRSLTFTPEDAGLSRFPLESLGGGDIPENAEILQALLQGRGTDAHRATVALNTAAVMWVAGHVDTLRDGARAAMDVLDGDRAWRRLERWIEVLNRAE